MNQLKNIKLLEPELTKEPTQRVNYPGCDSHQNFGINKMLDSYYAGNDGFLLADSMGIGKTRQILGFCYYLHQQGLTTVVVTENALIIDGFKKESEKSGIPVSCQLLTYMGLASDKVDVMHVDVALYDEAHNMKNAQSGKNKNAEIKIKSTFNIYSTATPMDTMLGACYFIRQVTGWKEEEVTKRLGIIIKESIAPAEHPHAGELITEVQFAKGVDYTQYIKNITEIKLELIQRGNFIRRYFETSTSKQEIYIDAPEDLLNKIDIIDTFWDDYREEMIQSGTWSRGMALCVGGQRLADKSKLVEHAKINFALQQIDRALKNGQRIVVVAEAVSYQHVKGIGKIIEGTLNDLAFHLKKKKIPFSKIFSGNPKLEEKEKFQKGETRVLLMTARSGGAGIDLDDQIGDAPRLLLILTPNYSGNILQQVFGRVDRRATKSIAKIEIVFFNQIDAEYNRKRIIGNKLATLENWQ